MDHLLTIGDFARRCGLSPSALRFYDECGLLRPVAVDDATGYRYYSQAQVSEGELVRRLRAADFSVPDASRYLKYDPEERSALLEAYELRVAERVALLRQALDYLRQDVARTASSPEIVVDVEATELESGLRQVRFAVAHDGHRPELAGIWLEVRDGSLRLVATDSYRLAIRDVPVRQGPPPGTRLCGLVPSGGIDRVLQALMASTVAGVADGPVSEGNSPIVRLRQAEDGGLALVLDGDEVRGANDGTFPQYEQFIMGLPTGPRTLVDRGQLRAALEAAAQAGDLATLEFTPAAVPVCADGQQAHVDASWEGPAWPWG